jgi:hypothetical protein
VGGSIIALPASPCLVPRGGDGTLSAPLDLCDSDDGGGHSRVIDLSDDLPAAGGASSVRKRAEGSEQHEASGGAGTGGGGAQDEEEEELAAMAAKEGPCHQSSKHGVLHVGAV